ncbi:class I SAM-dependent methyltransferase [Natrinema versiforme]|uniref:Class I SAM-dependent methyltransferase n=1 Tax=Natrinema versiforme TaxID=88724 RepID=A0A4P8WIZ9_9EURY|nr:class I SAM-dependent methyltransferase [Natrinema versiforme]QCS42013.1 class I SAM-dependent methyltransferase [Natrinema versiforme]
MDSISRWNEAQEVETDYHQEISYGQLDWLADRFDLSPDNLFGQKSVLEVGCGTGGLVYSIEEHVPDAGTIIGLDPILGKVSNPRLSGEPVIQGAGESLPFDDDFFDVAANINVLDHTVQPSTVLAEIARVLKPGGTFLFKINTYSLPEYIRNRIQYIDRPHPHHFSPSEIRDMLLNQGFHIEHESIESRKLFTRNVSDWSIKWIASTLFFRFQTMYIRCGL